MGVILLISVDGSEIPNHQLIFLQGFKNIQMMVVWEF